ncbi:MAG: putative rane protein [Bryobacterales bacterium]|nr:putative rane protein [Bryobacterales bacterium]
MTNDLGSTVGYFLIFVVGCIFLLVFIATVLEFRKQYSGRITEDEVKAFEKTLVKEKPFEAVALAKYYNQALTRANTAFAVSLLSAALGFGVILYAIIFHTTADASGTALKILSGTIIDAVSALFFVQSTNAQQTMTAFFEKLRQDRLNDTARELIGEIENAEHKDQLKMQLILKYAAIDKLLTVGG